MSRPTRITTDQILEAARELFFEKGYGVSTAEIAAAAGVSEGSIFKRFASKIVLFQQAMGIPPLDMEAECAPLLGKGDMRDNLVALTRRLLEFHRTMLPRAMLLWSNMGRDPIKMFKKHHRSPPREVIDALAAYLRAEMDLGRLARKDPSVLARMITGAAHTFVFHELIGGGGFDDDADGYVRAVVDVLMEGVRP